MLSTRASSRFDSLAIAPIVPSSQSLVEPRPLLGQGQQCVEPASHVLGAHPEQHPADEAGGQDPGSPLKTGEVLPVGNPAAAAFRSELVSVHNRKTLPWT